MVEEKVVSAIESIKEVVKDHSDADIYVDPNFTANYLLNQDPFHEVRRRRDKKKDVRLSQNSGYRSSTEARRPIEGAEQSMKSNPTDLSVPRGGYSRNDVAVNLRGSREFRVVRDNRVNTNVSKEMKSPSLRSSTSTSGQRSLQVSEKGSSSAANQKSSNGNYLPRQAPQTVLPQVQRAKPNDSKQLSAVLASNHSVIGVYSSSSDPVHVPSTESRFSANVGAIKRELGAVGVRRKNSGNSSALSDTISTSNLGKDGISSRESLKFSAVNSLTDQPSQTSQPEPILPNMSGSRPSSGNQYISRSHQQVAGHQKATQPAKEWKRKSSPKSNNNGHGVIGSPAKNVSHPADSSQLLEINAAHAQDKLSRVDICKNQNVFIAENIRVSDSDRSRLAFGSFGTEVDSFRTTVREGESPSTRVSISLSASIPGSPTVETSTSKHVDVFDDQVRNSGSNSPSSGGLSENLLPNTKGISSPQTLDNYANNNPSFTRTESHQQQDHPELASFSGYDPQAGYDIPYFRPSMDEPVRGQVLPSPQEALGSHMANNIPVSSIPPTIQQQQQQPMPQMYQQLHISPFANIMPYRQFISPVYGPPIPMTGYSGNPTYSHPSNGNSFLLMPGGSSHLGASNLKYGIHQFKPVPAGTPNGFGGNFASPAGVVGGATGLDESSRLKYKDGNPYLPNPQAETSEMWIQNPREIQNLQSGSYYNMPPHSAHTSYNSTAQSSHTQFPQGLYHHHRPNPHPQQQQPQMSHLNWNTNF